MDIRGVARGGGGGGAGGPEPPWNLADQLTLFKLGGHIMPHCAGKFEFKIKIIGQNWVYVEAPPPPF